MLLTRVLKGEVISDAEATDTTITTPDGREITLSRTGVPVLNAQGRVVEAVIVHRDVTAQRRVERQVAEQAAQLDTIFETITDGLVVRDADGHDLRMNEAYRQLLRLDLDPDFIARPLHQRAQRL